MTFKINKKIIFSYKNKLMINKKYKFQIKARILFKLKIYLKNYMIWKIKIIKLTKYFQN